MQKCVALAWTTRNVIGRHGGFAGLHLCISLCSYYFTVWSNVGKTSANQRLSVAIHIKKKTPCLFAQKQSQLFNFSTTQLTWDHNYNLHLKFTQINKIFIYFNSFTDSFLFFPFLIICELHTTGIQTDLGQRGNTAGVSTQQWEQK